MISTQEVVNTLIKKRSFLEEGLQQNIISYSALARVLQPEITKMLMKPIKLGAIVMALKRTAGKIQRENTQVDAHSIPGDITVRSNLIELTYVTSDTITPSLKTVFALVEERRDLMCTHSQGVRETTFIVSKEITHKVQDILAKERQLAKFENLSAISLLLSKETVDTPGAYYRILKLLAWENINIIEVISTYRELTILFRSEDIDRAFVTLSKNL